MLGLHYSLVLACYKQVDVGTAIVFPDFPQQHLLQFVTSPLGFARTDLSFDPIKCPIWMIEAVKLGE